VSDRVLVVEEGETQVFSAQNEFPNENGKSAAGKWEQGSARVNTSWQEKISGGSLLFRRR
jgi:hypothetical protein